MSMFSCEDQQQEQLKKDIFKLFVIYSRFEFALKASGYLVKKNAGKPAEPNWDLFVRRYKNAFKVSGKIEISFNFLTEQKTAPNRQVLVVSNKGELSTKWVTQNIDPNSPELKRVVDSIKLIRNNLFHGGKYGEESWNNLERARLLIEHVINVIWTLVELDKDIEAYFEDFA